ncbi:MAG TPA: flippase activity-associated protein Agl23 [Iamia sp.]|nr:flippase activity-associated protein Agl23 [Iamia sp.]
MRSLGRWKAAVVVTAPSAVAHLWRLGHRPLAHDEAIDAFFSWQARDLGVMRYDPVYHGPLRFYLEGLVLDHGGTSAAHARLVAAVAGIVATALIASSTDLLGRVGAPVAALVFTVSPTVLTVTRTGREDSLVGLVSLGLLLLVARMLTAPRPRHVVGAGVLLALSFTIKETTFLFGLNAAVFIGAGAALAALRPDGRCRAVVRRLASLGQAPWMWSLSAFALVFMVVFTSGFRYVEGVESGLFDGVRYWWGQHDVGRGGQPWFFYLAVYAAYEWLLLGLAAVGVVASVRRRSLVGAWLGVMALGHVALYSWAGEKFAWLALHPLLPAVLLAGIGAQAVADRVRGRAARLAVAGAGAVLATLTAVVAVRPAITHGADPRELLVTVQTSADLPPIAERLARAQRAGEVDTIVVDQTGGGSWPWAWYLHELDGVSYAPLDPQDIPREVDAVIVWAVENPPEPPEGYTVERFRLREWWVPAYGDAGADDLLRWFFTREPWSPTASSDQYLILRDPD